MKERVGGRKRNVTDFVLMDSRTRIERDRKGSKPYRTKTDRKLWRAMKGHYTEMKEMRIHRLV